MFQRINSIIDKYITKYTKDLELAYANTYTCESAITTTIIPKEDDYQSNVKDLELIPYGEVIILFTDIKNATGILGICEEEKILKVYSYYINYSSKLLGEILTIFKGRIIESTGDGNYSLIYKINNIEKILDNKNNGIIRKFLRRIIEEKNKEEFYKNMSDKEYLAILDSNEQNYILEMIENISSLDEKLRTLFFIIFASFNSKINKIDLLEKHNIKFATRIGCKIGLCQITNIEVKGHINQEKLIGSVVHKAAHQASGKKDIEKPNSQAEV